MDLLVEYVDREREELRDRGVRVRVIGERARLSDSARGAIDLLERTTGGGERLELQLAINYGSRQEIVTAIRALASRAARGELDPEEIDETRVSEALYTAGRPDPDLLIRTSGEVRISNFLLWQIAYAEIWVTDTLWPDFRCRHLLQALLDYQRRERRYGGLIDVEDPDTPAVIRG
jgi:undecaprenyl diphosphate synthase